MKQFPDGNGLHDRQAFGLTMPELGRVIFRDREGFETQLSAYDLIQMGSQIPGFIRQLLEHEHAKKKRDPIS